jgi:HSP20 family protein
MSNYPDFWKGSFFPTAFRDVDQFMDDWTTRRGMDSQILRPKCEVSELRNQYVFKLDVPGIPKDQIRIEFHDQTLTISGERKQEKYEDTKKLHLSELSYGSFMRTFSIPGPVHAENIQASYEHGILQVTVPKSEVSKAKQIQVR